MTNDNSTNILLKQMISKILIRKEDIRKNFVYSDLEKEARIEELNILDEWISEMS